MFKVLIIYFINILSIFILLNEEKEEKKTKRNKIEKWVYSDLCEVVI